jgi:hypothetical protein
MIMDQLDIIVVDDMVIALEEQTKKIQGKSKNAAVVSSEVDPKNSGKSGDNVPSKTTPSVSTEDDNCNDNNN